jgi:hypothetical protein
MYIHTYKHTYKTQGGGGRGEGGWGRGERGKREGRKAVAGFLQYNKTFNDTSISLKQNIIIIIFLYMTLPKEQLPATPTLVTTTNLSSLLHSLLLLIQGAAPSNLSALPADSVLYYYTSLLLYLLRQCSPKEQLPAMPVCAASRQYCPRTTL